MWDTLPNELQNLILEFLSGFDIHIIYSVNTKLQRAAKVFFTQALHMYLRDPAEGCVCKYFVDGKEYRSKSWKELSVLPVLSFKSREEVNLTAARYFYPRDSNMSLQQQDRDKARQLLDERGTVDLQDLLREEDFADDSDYDSDCSGDGDEDREERAYDRYLQALGECEGSGWTVSAAFQEISCREALGKCLALLAEARYFLSNKESLPGRVTGEFRSGAAIAMACFRSDLEPVMCVYANYGCDNRGQFRSSEINTRIVQVSFGSEPLRTQSVSIMYYDKSMM
jgi:hypothetical protein